MQLHKIMIIVILLDSCKLAIMDIIFNEEELIKNYQVNLDKIQEDRIVRI